MRGLPDIMTIGYEGATSAEIMDRLEAAGVARVIDIRAVPQSRKPGFSKRLLAGTLAERGIAYTHLQPLGTPKPGREAARRGDAAGMEAIFAAHMEGEGPRAALEDAISLAAEAPSCLLCFEHEPDCCHRRIVAGLIHARSRQRIRHL